MNLGEFLDLLRAKGVSQFSGKIDGVGPISVSFGPLEVKTSARAAQLMPDAVEMCACGHPPYNHNPFCQHGCEPDKCIPIKERKA